MFKTFILFKTKNDKFDTLFKTKIPKNIPWLAALIREYPPGLRSNLGMVLRLGRTSKKEHHPLRFVSKKSRDVCFCERFDGKKRKNAKKKM